MTMLEHQHQLMLATIKAALASIALHPHAHILEVVEDLGACSEQLADMPPINEHIMDGTIDRVVRAETKRILEEGRELRRIHLAGGAGELTPLDAASTSDITLDADIVGWVVDSQFGDLALHQLRISIRIARIADEEPMAAQNKDIAGLRDGGSVLDFRDFVGRIGGAIAEIFDD